MSKEIDNDPRELEQFLECSFDIQCAECRGEATAWARTWRRAALDLANEGWSVVDGEVKCSGCAGAEGGA